MLRYRSCGFVAKLRNPGFNAGNVAAQCAEAARFFELGAGLLQPEIENVVPEIAAIGQQLRHRLFLNLFAFFFFHSWAIRWREINLVLIGSLVAARRNDSRATASVTPSTSKSTLAGRITATQDSSGPLPLPMRVSRGFLVNDFCGKIRIHILPCRFILRAIATRAASICLVSSQQRSSACKPYSPKATLWPRQAKPARLPRCILRYFTLSGINGIEQSQIGQIGEMGRMRLSCDGFGLRLGFLAFGLAFANPAFDAQFAIDGGGLSKAVINVSPQSVQRHPAPVILLDAGQFGAAQPASATDLDAFSAEVFGGLERLLHGAAERNPAL